MRSVITAAGLLGFAGPLHAQPIQNLVENLRAIDINDYAVGFGVSTTESIYVDQEDSQTVYPFLTKLVPSALDDGVTFGRYRPGAAQVGRNHLPASRDQGGVQGMAEGRLRPVEMEEQTGRYRWLTLGGGPAAMDREAKARLDREKQRRRANDV